MNIVNWKKLPIELKDNIISILTELHFGFFIKEDEIIDIMNNSYSDSFPQFYFILDNNYIKGYIFLLKQEGKGMYYTHNIDTLSKEEAIYLYHQLIDICNSNHYHVLIDGIRFELEHL